jgi:hypothetical protein
VAFRGRPSIVVPDTTERHRGRSLQRLAIFFVPVARATNDGFTRDSDRGGM